MPELDLEKLADEIIRVEYPMEIFSIEVRKARVGVGYGTSNCETAWSNVWVCTDGWNTWLEEVKEDYEGERGV